VDALFVEYLPLGQAMHSEEPFLEEKNPAVQEVHTELPGDEYNPAEQFLQKVAPDTLEKVPERQDSQYAPVPLTKKYCPSSHSTQLPIILQSPILIDDC
jgi:hypothetical protein